MNARQEIEKGAKDLLIDITLKLAQDKTMQGKFVSPTGQHMLEYSCLVESVLNFIVELDKRVTLLEQPLR